MSRKKAVNEMRLEFLSDSRNESFARSTVCAFASQLDPTVGELTEIRTAVSEAVTNAVIHGYENRNSTADKIYMMCSIRKDVLEVEVEDRGVGIEDVPRAMEPLFTTKPEMDRSGMGFAFMEAFMDNLEVHSIRDAGTKVRMHKKIGISSWIDCEE